MKQFTGSEVAFSHTYFSAHPDRLVEIKTVHPLAVSEVPETAGSYSFSDDGCGFYNRTLFWRTESSRIHFNEICATQEVIESSLCLDLHPSVVIPGTTVSFYRGVLIIVVPTPSAIHRFLIRLGNYSEINSGTRSALSYFPTSENYRSVYDYHFFTNGTTVSKASIAHDFSGNTVAVVTNNRHQLVTVHMPFIRQNPSDVISENYLGEGSVIGRLFKRNLDPTLGLTLAFFNSELFVVSVQSDGKIRIWSARDGSFKGAFLIKDCLRSDLEFDVDDLIIKSDTCFDKHIIIVKIQLVKKVKFLVLSYQNNDLIQLTSCDLYATSVVDFLFVESSNENREISLWAISRESYEDDKQQDTMYQPYLLRNCLIDLNGTTESEWKIADPAVPNAVMDKLIFENLTIESVKQRIFDGDTYSFETVQRAVQTICKCPTIAIQYRDWQALSRFSEEFIQSGQFIQMYLSDQYQNSLMTSNTVDQTLLANAYERFWLDVQKCCNQFQETLLYPIAIWHSPTLDLVGTIQSCRFTVYVAPDSRMQSIVLSHSSAIDVFFDIVKNYVASDFQLTNTDADQQMACKVKTDILCRIVQWFSEREEEPELNLVPMKSAFLESSFSTTLLATALRQRILSRLCFARVVSTIIKLLPEIFMLADKNFDQRSLSTISSQLSSISATVKHYNTLWFSLSSTFLMSVPHSARAPKLVTIAQAFFKSGLPFSHDRSTFLDEDMDDMDGMEGGGGDQLQVSNSEFSRFIDNALNDATICLWPESKAMTFPRFLANNKYYETLRDYCEKNQPYISELSAVFYYFQGVACAGTGFPDYAASFFEEASQGIVAENETLNGVLSTYTNQPFTHKHTLTEYYYVVMNIFKASGQTEFVIRAGMFALKFAANQDPLLSTIYALMFNQYVQTEQYFEAIRVLHMNPSKESQDNCLRSLIVTLWNLRRTKSLVDLHYAELTDRVAELLETKCRLMPLLADNCFFEVVYAFYFHRYNYEHAARIMYFLCWRLRWVPQSREVLEKRLRVLSCVCQTVEMLPENHTISLEVDLKELMNETNSEANQFIDDNLDGKLDRVNKWFSLNNVDKKTLYDEYLVLEARLALLNSGNFPNGPPVNSNDIYEVSISHRLYDTAFVVQRRFDLDVSRLFNALTLDCISIGFEDKAEIPNWVFSNSRFVDYVNKDEDSLRSHWKLLVAFIDLTLKVEPANVVAIHQVAELFLERSLSIPKWLEVRYLKVNPRYFYQQLIEFDELNYAMRVLDIQLNKLVAQKIRPQEIHTIPLVHINALYNLAFEKAGENPDLSEKVEQSRELLSKIMRSMKVMSHGAYVR